MLRRAAAAAAWLFIPVCGYLLSFFFPAPDCSSSSPDRTTSKSRKRTMIYNSKSALPSEWDYRRWGRNQPAQQYLKVDGLTVKYTGPGETDAQAACIYADKPVPQDVPLYYFEIEVLNKGEHGSIGIGFCTDDVNLGRLPGWEPHSYGYHGDDGHVFHGSGQGRSFGPRFNTGDVIGALLDQGTHTISYYKNGEPLGTAFYRVTEERMYPCAGFRAPNEEIRANFGSGPFAVDLAALQAQFKERVLQSIEAMQLPAAVDLTAPAAAATTGGGSKKDWPAVTEAATAVATGGRGSGGSSGDGAAAAAAAITAEARSRSQAARGAAVNAAVSAAETAAAGAETPTEEDGAAAAAAAGGGGGGGAPGRNSSSASSMQHQPLLPHLIFDYLLHQRCWRTAAVVARDMLGGTSDSNCSSRSDAGSDAARSQSAAVAEQNAAAMSMECSSSADAAMTDAAAAAPSTNPAVVAKTAATSSTAGGLSQADIEDALRRQQIFDAVVAGQLTAAMAQVQTCYGSGVLESNPALAFKLKVQQFVELVRQACSSSSDGSAGAAATSGSSSNSADMTCFEGALAYGRAELGPASKPPEDEELLSDALSLLAYADPAASPCGHLLRSAHRAELAEELNGALLKARGTSPQPLLEAMYRQTAVLLEELQRQSNPQALVLDVAGMCLRGEAAQLHLRRQQRKKAQQKQAGSSAAAAVDAMQQDD